MINLISTAKRLALILACAIGLSGCATMSGGPYPGLAIDSTFTAKSQENRVQFLILHFTAGDFPGSLKILTEGPVSSHYLVTDGNGVGIGPEHDNKTAKIYQLVDESRRAHHAGLSSWKGFTRLNGTSIGIEIVNRGYKENAKGERDFIPYPKEQLDLVMELSRRIIEQYNIRPEFVLGHSDIAPTRKPDPGPLFPWKRFADEGLIVWPKESEVAVAIKQYENNIPDVPWFQRKLAEHGFEVPRDGFPNSMEPDEATRRSIRAFQAKYRQNDIRGNLDAETAAMLDVITRKPDATPRPAAPDSVADFKVQ